MPITVAKIANNTASVTLNIGEDTVTVVYFPGRVTEKTLAALNAFSTMDEKSMEADFEAFNQILAKLIQSWDVLENDNVTMFPIDPARLAELPFVFRIQIINAIMRDIRPETIAPQIQN